MYCREDGFVNWTAYLDAACPKNCIENTGPHVLIARNPTGDEHIGGEVGRAVSLPHSGRDGFDA